jgi:hypothetical protein
VSAILVYCNSGNSIPWDVKKTVTENARAGRPICIRHRLASYQPRHRFRSPADFDEFTKKTPDSVTLAYSTAEYMIIDDLRVERRSSISQAEAATTQVGGDCMRFWKSSIGVFVSAFAKNIASGTFSRVSKSSSEYEHRAYSFRSTLRCSRGSRINRLLLWQRQQSQMAQRFKSCYGKTILNTGLKFDSIAPARCFPKDRLDPLVRSQQSWGTNTPITSRTGLLDRRVCRHGSISQMSKAAHSRLGAPSQRRGLRRVLFPHGILANTAGSAVCVTSDLPVIRPQSRSRGTSRHRTSP